MAKPFPTQVPCLDVAGKVLNWKNSNMLQSGNNSSINEKYQENLIIFDTTLRDGEQSPGVTLMIDEKVRIAKELSRLGVDVCEAGFPIASDGDFEAVTRIAKEVGPMVEDRAEPMTICGLARAKRSDIMRAYDAIKWAPKHRIHTFLATSDIHLKHKLKISRKECIKMAVDAVLYAKSLCDDVEFSPEDAGRSDYSFLIEVLDAVIDAGASTINIPDTVGYNIPDTYGKMMGYLIANVRNSKKVVWSTHCHNDLGLATANTLAGIQNGARQVEVTINGIGERAGNTSLEEIVMVAYTHRSLLPVFTRIHTPKIYSISQLVSKLTGMSVQPNKAIVGRNAFVHESGIHQDGFLKCQQTYEIMHPGLVGVQANQLFLGKHSGRNAIRNHLKGIGYADGIVNSSELFEKFFIEFKKLADQNKSGELNDEQIRAIATDVLN